MVGQRAAGVSPAARALLTVLLALFAAYFLFPIYWLVIAAGKSTQDLYSTFGLWLSPHPAYLHNLLWTFTYQHFEYLRWALNSGIYSVTSSVVSAFISAMAGFALSQYRFRGQRLVQSLTLGALMVPGAALVIPLFLLIKYMGLIDHYLGVILPMLFSPFGVYFMQVYLRGAVHPDMLDAGRVDGAGEFILFARIVLPVIVPGLVTLVLLGFVGAWNNFFLPLVLLSNPALFPLTLGLSVWSSTVTNVGAGPPLYPILLMGSVLSIVPLAAVFLYLRRYIIAGLALGGLRF